MTRSDNTKSTSEPSTQDGSFVKRLASRWAFAPIDELRALPDWRQHDIFTKLTVELVSEVTSKGWEINSGEEIKYHVANTEPITEDGISVRPCVVEMPVLLTPLQVVEEQIEIVKEARTRRCCHQCFVNKSAQLASLLFERDAMKAAS